MECVNLLPTKKYLINHCLKKEMGLMANINQCVTGTNSRLVVAAAVKYNVHQGEAYFLKPKSCKRNHS